MQFKLTAIEMDNAAFEDAPATELGTILQKIGRQIMRGQFEGTCFDSNGNRVGEWEVTR